MVPADARAAESRRNTWELRERDRCLAQPSSSRRPAARRPPVALVVAGVVVGGLLGAGAGGAFSPECSRFRRPPDLPVPGDGSGADPGPGRPGDARDGSQRRRRLAPDPLPEPWPDAKRGCRHPRSGWRSPPTRLPIADCQPRGRVGRINVSPGPTLSVRRELRAHAITDPSTDAATDPEAHGSADPATHAETGRRRGPRRRHRRRPRSTRAARSSTAPVPNPTTFFDADSAGCAPSATSTDGHRHRR